MNEAPTLAAKLGTTTHLSPLLRKAGRLGLGPGGLRSLAVQRGCQHYSSGSNGGEISVSKDQFADEELAIALLCVALPYSPQNIRCGAAMLGAEANDPHLLAHLGVIERSVVPVRYVAESGRRFEPDNPFWQELLAALPPSQPPKAGVMPHPTRFVAMSGFTRNGPGLVVEWQRPSLQWQPMRP